METDMALSEYVPEHLAKAASDYLMENGGGPTDYTVDGECSMCGECCTCFLPLLRSEVPRLEKLAEGLVPYMPKSGNRGIDLSLMCPFLWKRGSRLICRIYDQRPAICRAYRCDWDAQGKIQCRALCEGIDVFAFERDDVVDMDAWELFGGRGRWQGCSTI